MLRRTTTKDLLMKQDVGLGRRTDLLITRESMTRKSLKTSSRGPGGQLVNVDLELLLKNVVYFLYSVSE